MRTTQALCIAFAIQVSNPNISTAFLTTTTTTSFATRKSYAISSSQPKISKNTIRYADAVTTAETDVSTIDPKEMVKLFGRLAEKYIMLDSSGGMCCYSACSDCEFRLPDGGYRMADQSASRPKWIPVYDNRVFESVDKEHTTKWSTEIFTNGPAVTKDEFIEAVVSLPYAPPLGGPYVGASAAKIDDMSAAGALFHILAGEKEKLTRHRMSLRMKELAGGEEGLTWAAFSSLFTSS